MVVNQSPNVKRFNQKYTNRQGFLVTEEIHSSRDRRKVVVIPLDLERANRIRTFAASRGWFISRSKSKWAVALAKLRRQLKQEHRQIDEIFDWYTSRQDSVASLPQIRNGQDLCRCWEWLVDVRRKEQLRQHTNISPAARSVVDRLRHWNWPGRCFEELPGAVQKSLDNLDAFLSSLRLMAKSSFANRVAEEVCRNFSDPVQFVQSWWGDVARWCCRPSVSFGGGLSSFVISTRNEKFRSEVGKIILRWGGPSVSSVLDSLWKEVGRED